MQTTSNTPGRLLRLQRLIGRGGFGEVYEGQIVTTTGLSRRVAVKRLRKDLADSDDALLRLYDEARLLGHLRHPVVVSVEDLIQLDGHVTLISEFIDGVDLSAATPLPARAALEASAKVAEALAAAWGQRGPDGGPLRIVHRDIKPANIRLGPHGVVKLLDFGIARTDTVTRAAKTSTGMMVGSMGYMAPERWLAQPDGHAGDVFALGCVLFEALSGEALHAGMSTPAQVGLAMSAERFAAFLEERLAALPSEGRRAERLLRDMLAHDPNARPSAAEVADRASALAARVRGDSLLAWSRCLDGDSTPTGDDVSLDSSWVEGPSGFSRVTPEAGPLVPTLEQTRPLVGEPPPGSTSRTVRARPRGRRGMLAAAGVVGALALGLLVVAGLAVAAIATAMAMPHGAAWVAGGGLTGADGDPSGASPGGAEGLSDNGAPRGLPGGVLGDAAGLAGTAAGSASGSEPGAGDPSAAPEAPALRAGASADRLGAIDSAPAGGAQGASTPGVTEGAVASGPRGGGGPAARGDSSTARDGPRAVVAQPEDPAPRSSATSEPRPATPSAAPAGDGSTGAGDATGSAGSAGTSVGSTATPARAPAASPTGTVTVEGISTVRLRGPSGVVEPGAVPAGAYVVQASFDTGVWTDALTVQVRAGAAVRVACSARFRRCQEVR